MSFSDMMRDMYLKCPKCEQKRKVRYEGDWSDHDEWIVAQRALFNANDCKCTTIRGGAGRDRPDTR